LALLGSEAPLARLVLKQYKEKEDSSEVRIEESDASKEEVNV